MSNSKAPSLLDMHHAPELAQKNEQFISLVNRKPRKDWIQEHPIAKRKIQGRNVPTLYIPIGRVEDLLDKLFQQWKIEVLQVQPLFNSVCTTVRVHYVHPITGQWTFHDGVGAMAVQTDAGASAADLGAIKSNAIAIAAPASKTYAVKDAVHHIGRIFGRDLNREYEADDKPVYIKEDTRERERLLEWLKSDAVTLPALDDLMQDEVFFKKYEKDTEVMSLIGTRQNEL